MMNTFSVDQFILLSFFYGGGEGYKYSEKVKEFRFGKRYRNAKKTAAHFVKRNIQEDDEPQEDEQEHYVHGVKIDKDIQELVERELKDINLDKKRNVFLSKRNPIDMEEDIEGDDEDDDKGNNVVYNDTAEDENDYIEEVGDGDEGGDEGEDEGDNIINNDTAENQNNYIVEGDEGEDEGDNIINNDTAEGENNYIVEGDDHANEEDNADYDNGNDEEYMYIPKEDVQDEEDAEEVGRREREERRNNFLKNKIAQGFFSEENQNESKNGQVNPQGNNEDEDGLDDGEVPDNEENYQVDEEEYEAGEVPDNEDEGIGIIPKDKVEEKIVLKNDDFIYNNDGSIKVIRTDKVPTRKPYINKYIYPNAAKHYRFPNIYLSDKFITLGFEKSRDTFEDKNARWIDKFYGSMGMTNAVIAEDMEKSTLVNMLEHSPYVYNRDLFEMTRQRYEKYIDLVLGHRFRSAMDVVPPYIQIMYLRLYASQPDFEKEFDEFYDSVYVHDIRNDYDNRKRKTRSILKFGFHIVDFAIKNKIIRFGAVFDDLERNALFFKELIEHQTLLFFNLNDDYNIPEAAEQFKQFMEFLFPQPSIFEKPGF